MNPMRMLLTLSLCLLSTVSAGLAQDVGDQLLDGIGETALIARYPFAGNAEDRSRNDLHAAALGTARFVEDPRFGPVLSLSGERGAHVELPGGILGDTDSITVTGWLFLRKSQSGQRFFDFGQNAGNSFFATTHGTEGGMVSRITAAGASVQLGSSDAEVPTNRWVHVAVVVDVANRTIANYIDGAEVDRATNVSVTPAQTLGAAAASNHLYLGRSQNDAEVPIDASFYDVRIYRIALSGDQVATIRRNAPGGERGRGRNRGGRRGGRRGARRGGRRQAPPPPPPAAETARFDVGRQLESVPHIDVATVVGHLPTLPATIPAVYAGGGDGPEVPVVWPAATDNSETLATGTYRVTGKVLGTPFEPEAIVAVREGEIRPAPTRQLSDFALGQVTLNPDAAGRATRFIENRDKFVLTLAQTDPDSFLYNFRDAFGQEQPPGVRPLRGWDSQTTRLRGHGSGHYLTAIAQAYASTGYDPALQTGFLAKMTYVIDALYELSRMSGKPVEPGGSFNADPTRVRPGPGKESYDSDLSVEGIRTDYWNWGEGFISGYPPDQFIMLEHGATYGGSNRQIWAPYYTLHKILAGLLDCFEVGGNEKALKIAKGMGSWVRARLAALSTETRIQMWNRYIAGEYGGMNEVMARLARLTGDSQFLEGAQLFDNIDFFFGNVEHDHGLAKNVDTIRGKHANQHIPQITGALETYRNNGELPYFLVAENFWTKATNDYMYAIGGVAGARNPNNGECFAAQPGTLFENGFNRGTQNETCATYNLLKLDRQLFLFEPDAKYLEHYERALYNHILASVAQDSPANAYHVPLDPGQRKRFGNGNMTGFTCCNGTAIESGTKLQDTVYFRSADNTDLYVNLFVPSTLNWTEREVTVEQQTGFPYSDMTKLVIHGSGDFGVHLRVPLWATNGNSLSVNGEAVQVPTEPGSYVTLDRTWSDEDTIELRMPFGFRLERVRDQPNIASMFYGPVLLAAQEPEARSDWRKIALDADDISNSIEGDPSTLQFMIDGVPLKPFFDSYDRYSVYFDVTMEK